MIRTLSLMAMLTLCLAGTAYAGDDKSHDHAGVTADTAEEASPETKTVTGQFVDGGCYLRRDAKGGDHKECAIDCLKGGGMLGFAAEDGTFYVIGNANPMESDSAVKDFNSKFVEWIGKDVNATGTVTESHGINLMHLESVQNPKNGKVVIDLSISEGEHAPG